MLNPGSYNQSQDFEIAKRKQILLIRNLYRSFVDNSFEIIFRTSLDDTLQFSNKLFLKTFGFESFKQIRGLPAQILFEREADYLDLKQKLIDNICIDQQLVHLKKLSGHRVIGLLKAHSHRNELNETVLNWTVLDISERVEFENNLEAKNQQLAKVNHQMEKFLYSTSHDLRSPLTSIMGIVNLIRMDSNDDAMLDYVNKIEISVNRLDKIIKDIISFSKTTYQHIHSEKIDFESLIWRVVNNHLNGNNRSNQRIEIAVSVTGNHAFYSDTDRVEIILDNLVRNAIQFTDFNKVKPFVHVNVNLLPEFVNIEVHDNGIGIANDYFDLIFNMFYKASLISKGAGLGLYIAKESLEQLGGNVVVASEVGFGSVFKVFIPNSPKGKLINRKHRLRNVPIQGT